jgi:pimeloyl-ACP methyl ester carboxylesterase
MRALRLLALVALLVVVAGGLAWRSGNRPPFDEVALAERRLGIPLESRRIATGEVTLHAVFAGPEDGPPVVLLHGFPEFWFSWHRQMAALAAAGFRVVAPDQRGANRSDRPRDRSRYGGQHLGADVLGLLDALGWEDAYFAGHDVGGGVLWRLVYASPERVRAAVLFNVGHPAMWSEANPGDDSDSISWYRSFFRLPFLPELVGRSGDWWLLGRNLRATSRPGTFDDAELAIYKAAWARDNAISSMINTYRSEWSELRDLPSVTPVPVRLVWGEQDAFQPLEAARLSERHLEPGAVLYVPEAGHWILLEAPELTSRVMSEFFQEEE